MNNHPWHTHCLAEIERAISSGRKIASDWEKAFLKTVRPRIQSSIGLTDKQEESLRRMYTRMTDPARIKR